MVFIVCQKNINDNYQQIVESDELKFYKTQNQHPLEEFIKISRVDDKLSLKFLVFNSSP